MGPAATLLAVARAGKCATTNLAEGLRFAQGWGRAEPLHPEVNLVIYSALIKALDETHGEILDVGMLPPLTHC
jgi:hypothetical protein